MSAYSVAVLADSPRTYWRLNETSGTTIGDSSGNGHGGTASSSMPPGSTASLIPTDADTSITFDYTATLGPISALGAAASGYAAAAPVTCEFWVRPVDLTTSGSVCVVVDSHSGSQGWTAYFAPSTGIWHWVNQGVGDISFSSSEVASAGVTQHVVFVLSTVPAVTLYINGVFQQTLSIGAMNTVASTQMSVGGQTDGAHPVKAAIDEVAIYATALSAARIAAHYVAAGGTLASSGFVTKSWGNDTTGGTPLNATGLNDLETRIAAGFTDVAVPYVDAAGNGVTATPHALGQPALDQAPILRALLRAGALNGQTVVLPKGVIWIGSQVLIPYGTRLVGQGKNATVIKARSDFPTSTPLVRLADYPIDPDVVFNTRLEHLQIHANDIAGSTCVYATNQIQEGCGVFHCILTGFRKWGAEMIAGQNFDMYELECYTGSPAGEALGGILLQSLSGHVHVSCVTSSGQPGSGAGIKLAGTSCRLSDIHVEGYLNGVHITDGGGGIVENVSADANTTNTVKIDVNSSLWTLLGIQSNGAPVLLSDDFMGLTIAGSDHGGVLSNYIQNTIQLGNTMMYSTTAVPAAGTWARGTIVWNATPSASGPPGWVCVTAGTPGTWKAMANLAA